MTGVPITDDVDVGVVRLLAGGLVAMPTETVYGLGADAENPSAVARVFAVKGRPTDHPLIVHVAGVEHVDGWTADLSPAAATLAATCWPGPLTLLVLRGPRVLDAVTGGRETVGLRVPAHPVAQTLLRRSGRGIAAPSANRFGRVSPTTAAHVAADIGAFLDPARDVILDGGASPVGVESTIVDCSVDPPQLLRPGGIPNEDIERLLDAPLAAPTGPSRAAGMQAAHYAPRATVVTVADRREADAMAGLLEAADHRVVLVDFGDDLVAYARQLYAELRAADDGGADHVVAVLPPARGLGHAIRDRLAKAAAAAR